MSNSVLPNSFVDLLVVVGIDENIGLVPLSVDADSCELSEIFYHEYEPQVLAAVSSTTALYFHPQPRTDPDYPPSPKVVSSPTKADIGDGFGKFRSKTLPNTGTVRSTSVHPATTARRLTRRMTQHHMVIKTPKLPSSDETIRSLPTFCFPDNTRVFRESQEELVHFLVLTDLNGNRSYAACLTFCLPYNVEKGTDDTFTLSLNLGSTSADEDRTQCYAPLCCVLMSKQPYLMAMKECLSCLVMNINRDPEEMYTFVKDVMHHLSMTPMPPAGSVSVEVTVYGIPFLLMPPNWSGKPVVDLPIHLVFLCFNMDEILKIITAMLIQERIVFVSNNYALLTVIMECFHNFILPFVWRVTYVPILPGKSLDFLDAVGTFMFGCHSRFIQEVEQVEGLVVVNIDNGTVSVNPNLEDTTSGPSVTIPVMPEEAANIFRKACESTKYKFDLIDIQRSSIFNLEEEKKIRATRIQKFNTSILFHCLELMVNLFRGVVLEIRVDLRRFNKQNFMEIQSADNIPFYEKVLASDMFRVFLDERMNEKSDYWSDLEVKTRPQVNNRSGSLDSIPIRGRARRHSTRTFSVSHFVSPLATLVETTAFQLPPLKDTDEYIQTCLKELSLLLKDCRDLQQRASYIYLRGMFNYAADNKVEAVNDFLSLSATNNLLMPVDVLKRIIKELPEKDRDDFLDKTRFHHLTDLIDGPAHSQRRKSFIEPVKIPEHDVDVDDFMELISLLEVTTDYDTMQRLFQALTLNTQEYIDQTTMEVFYDFWQENQANCSEIEFILDRQKLLENEFILKVSSLTKTDFGTGRIVLTEKRLFFLKDVSNKYKEIIKLRDIESLEKTQLYSFLAAVNVLKIEGKGFHFTAWLKEERNTWYILINEMWAGKLVAEGTKDFGIIRHAAQNVLLIDTIILSGQEECTFHSSNVEMSANTLCYFTKYKEEGRHRLPEETMRMLKHRIDPNVSERERKAVQAVLYTPGDPAKDKLSPRLWCAMGDGKIKVYDAITWELESNFVQAKNTVVCLMAIGLHHVWAGSHGVYIIDTETITCNKTLVEHRDLVTAIIPSDEPGYVFTASLDGTIFKWDAASLRIAQRLELPNVRTLRSMTLFEGKLWCCSKKGFHVMSLDGQKLHEIPHLAREGRPVEIDCFQILNSGQIWGGCRREGRIIIWNLRLTEIIAELEPDCKGISNMVLSGQQLWVGTKTGMIYIYDMKTRELQHTLRAHDDAIRAMGTVESRYIVSGAGSRDGKITIWQGPQAGEG